MSAPAASIMLAGGGSGGHIAPGLAIAERLRESAPDVGIVFACSTRAVDAQMLDPTGFEYRPIPAEHLSKSPLELMRFVKSFADGRSVTKSIIRERNVRGVVALGGFVTGPVVSAAQSLGVPVMLVNLDATPGKANRWVAKRAKTVLSACPTPSEPNFARAVVGMPVRRAAIATLSRDECRAKLGLEPGLHTLLVTGASQGAKSLNDLVALMLMRERAAFGGWQVLHLVGSADRKPVEDAYREAGVHAKVLPFLHEMGLGWGAADAALSRAGANSVAEAVLNAVPTVFAPYPYHADRHQRFNAEPYVREGLALMEDDHVDAEKNLRGLGAALRSLLTEAPRRTSMRAALEAKERMDAASALAHTALRMAGLERKIAV
ncbi:MAG: UDP-N-acetylglucosamine--N-acetylmuramyl-(pentapeptide) pyrophosphoryl-undecaprenol N-acetylglucosamine transferase [Planctomycetota bacterium]